MSIPDSASQGGEQSRVQQWSLALQHLQDAIKILDESDAPPHLGAGIDLTIHRLRDIIQGAT